MTQLRPPTDTLILNVDDNEAGLYAKSRVLRRAGYAVVEARTGSEALSQLRAHRPRLVMLDVHLPDMDGRDVCAQIKSDHDFAGTLVLQTSATFVESQHRVAGLERGADMYLVEPVESAELLAMVRALLRLQEAERGLRASERRYRTLAQAAPVGIFHTDAAGRWIYANESWYSMAGWTAGEPPPSDWLAAVHPEDRERVAALWDAAVACRTPYRAEHRLLRPDGSSLHVWSQALPEPGEDHCLGGFIGSATDITDRKLAEQALREADHRKDEFLAMLAHELRNPLQPISNAIQLIDLQKPDNRLIQQASEVINRQVSHLARLVDDLLDVSRITRGHVHLEKEPVALRLIMESALESARPLIQARRHALKVSIPPEPLTLHGDATRLAQVLLNLLNNAAKYTAQGGHIEFDAARDGNDIVIRVSDDGPGIAPDLLPYIFDLFTQASRTLDRSEGGLGIGLTLARRLTELHDGRIEALSSVGSGSQFIVRLPLYTGESRQGHAADGRYTDLPSQRILVVDDNRDAAETLRKLLELSGHVVRTAHDGPSALVTARDLRPSLVFLDIGLPGMDGYEVAQRMREEALHKDVLLVAMTGYGQASDQERSRHADFFAHLVKPVSFDDINVLLTKTAPRHAGWISKTPQ